MQYTIRRYTAKVYVYTFIIFAHVYLIAALGGSEARYIDAPHLHGRRAYSNSIPSSTIIHPICSPLRAIVFGSQLRAVDSDALIQVRRKISNVTVTEKLPFVANTLSNTSTARRGARRISNIAKKTEHIFRTVRMYIDF